MRHLPLILALALPLPALAQDAQGSDTLMERGLRLFMEGLMQEMEPALRDLEDLAEEARPLLEQLQEDLGAAVGDLNAYHAPEILPNGDIILRRKEPLPVEDIDPNPDGSIDL